jgi:hypothetical protein
MLSILAQPYDTQGGATLSNVQLCSFIGDAPMDV